MWREEHALSNQGLFKVGLAASKTCIIGEDAGASGDLADYL